MSIAGPARSLLVSLVLGGAFATASPVRAAPSEVPADVPADAPQRRWQAALVDLGLAPDCATALGAFIAPTGDAAPTPPGTPLERTPPDGQGILLRLSQTGGIPFWGPKDRLVRGAAHFDREIQSWLARRDDLAPNRGYARWSPAPGRELLIVDHMRSPINAATSIWEDTGKKVVLRAEFPAEIVAIEDRGTEKVLSATDNFNAVAVAWDVAKAAFVGKCLVVADAAASSPVPLSEALFQTAPTLARLAKTRPLWLLPPGADVDATYRIATVPARAPAFVLYTRPDGASFVLVAWRDTSPATVLFRAAPGRLWQLGWLAPGALSR